MVTKVTSIAKNNFSSNFSGKVNSNKDKTVLS